jgi:microsomal prostaglandin-E synthase 2
VPIATINNDIVLKGSDEIIKGLLQQDSVVSLLEQRWANDNALRGSSSDNDTKVAFTLQDFVGNSSVIADLGDDNVDSESSSEVEEWLRFADDELASLLYPNICRTWSDSYQAFSYVNKIDSFSTIQKMSIQLMGSVAMYLAASRVKSMCIVIALTVSFDFVQAALLCLILNFLHPILPFFPEKRNITDERKALEDALATVITHLEGTDNTFLSGMPEPHLGDLAVYGVLRSIEGLPTHTEVVMNREGPLKDWYMRMQQKANNPK